MPWSVQSVTTARNLLRLRQQTWTVTPSRPTKNTHSGKRTCSSHWEWLLMSYPHPFRPFYLRTGTFRKQCHLVGTPNRQSTEGRNTNRKTLMKYYELPRTWSVLKTVANSLTSCATIGPSRQILFPDSTAIPAHGTFIAHNSCIRRFIPR